MKWRLKEWYKESVKQSLFFERKNEIDKHLGKLTKSVSPRFDKLPFDYLLLSWNSSYNFLKIFGTFEDFEEHIINNIRRGSK
jgi:hypothetical protein